MHTKLELFFSSAAAPGVSLTAHSAFGRARSQYYFILRVIVTCWDYSFEVRDRASYPNPKVHLAIATGILVAIICLQILNSLLVRRLARRKKARCAELGCSRPKSPRIS